MSDTQISSNRILRASYDSGDVPAGAPVVISLVDRHGNPDSVGDEIQFVYYIDELEVSTQQFSSEVCQDQVSGTPLNRLTSFNSKLDYRGPVSIECDFTDPTFDTVRYDYEIVEPVEGESVDTRPVTKSDLDQQTADILAGIKDLLS